MLDNCFFSACRQIAPHRRQGSRLLLLPVLLLGVAFLPTAAQAAVASTTVLTLPQSVASPPAVVLTALVAPLTTGTITFCDDASATTHCPDAAVVGRAQLTSSGSATLTTLPAPGSHTYKAIFSGTATVLGSTSDPKPLTISRYPSTTALSYTGTPSGYGLTATVVGMAFKPLAAAVSFTDITTGTALGAVPLGPSSFVQAFIQPPSSIPTGNSPAVAGVGDFNEDGITDLAVVNAGDETISILQGDGHGAFALASTVPSFGTPICASPNFQSNCAIVVGDFNDDGHADLAVTSGNDNTLTILEGNGHGLFTPFGGSPISVGHYPEAVKIGDFNNDGILDLAVANAADGTVSILLGNGDGTFTPASGSPITAGNFPFFLAVGYFNADNNADLAVVNGNGGNVTILLGNGDGTFTQASGSPINVGSGPGAGASPIVAADFNNDGFTDLAVANYNDNDVDILQGNGDGTFLLQPSIPVGAGPFAMVSLDYNGDGYTDLAVANYGDGTLTLLKGSGSGLTPDGGAIALGVNPVFPNDVVTADFNGDGAPDLAIPESGSTNTGILLNQVTQTATASLQNVVLAGGGIHVVQASYPGNADYAPSSATVSLQGLTIQTTLTLSANPTQQLFGLPVTFTAQLNPTAAQPPTGTVSFFDAGVLLGTVAINGAGQAAYTTSALADGMHSITASYSGDTIFQPSAASALSITISDLQISRAGNNNPTVIPGTTVVYTVQVAPVVASTFLYNVTLSASGLPAGAIATFTPATLAAGGQTTTATMTVATSRTAANVPPPLPFERLPLALGLLLPFIGSRAVRRRLRQLPRTLGVLLLAALSLTAVAGLSGCAGAGIFAARKVPYSITVIATEGNATGTLSRSTEVPLAIQ